MRFRRRFPWPATAALMALLLGLGACISGRPKAVISSSPTVSASGSSATPTPSSSVPNGGGMWKAIAEHGPVGESQTSVWTGQELLVWSGSYHSLGHGAAFNPTTMRWRDIRGYRIGGVGGAIAVWTGREMIVWGGSPGQNESPPNTGAAYDPHSDSWRSIPAAPLAGGDRSRYTGFWTGSELWIWGIDDSRSNARAQAAAYDPKANRWHGIDPGPLGVRHGVIGVYTGKEILLWGGRVDIGGTTRYLTDGAAFNLDSGKWRRIPSSPIEGRALPAGAWTGHRFIVWGGNRLMGSLSHFRRDGASFDPSSNEWERLPDAPIAPRWSAAVATTGTAMIVWGGLGPPKPGDEDESPRKDGGVYDTTSRSWRLLPVAPLAPRSAVQSAWTGTELIVWSGCCTENGTSYSDGAIYRP